MDAQEFSGNWLAAGDTLEQFDPETISKLAVSEVTKSFLRVGLPNEAAPFLSFGPSSDATLQSMLEQYDLSTEYSDYLIIGFNAYGDPICLDTNTEQVVCFNHDANFGGFFMNSSVRSLCEFLLIIRSFIEKLVALDAEDSKEQKKLLKTTLKELSKIDKKAVKKGGWDGAVRDCLE